MICYPDKLNKIAGQLNEATAAWLIAAQNHDHNEIKLSKKVDEFMGKQEREENRLRSVGYTILYDYVNHRYLAVNETVMSGVTHI